MKPVRWALLLVFATLAGTAPAAAQSDTVALWRALAPSCPGAEVRLALVTADSLRGYCGRVDYGRMVVRQGTAERQIALAQIDSVWVRGRATASVGRLGGFIGALSVGGAFYHVSNGICDDTAGCGSETTVATGLGALLGYLTGSFFGGMIGRTMTVWDRRYP